MNRDHVIVTKSGTFRIESDFVDVYSALDETHPDPNWSGTDIAGHNHNTKSLKLTTHEVRDTHFCLDCNDDHERIWRACNECGDLIEPGTIVTTPAYTTKPILVNRRYYRDGEEILRQEFEDFLRELRGEYPND